MFMKLKRSVLWNMKDETLKISCNYSIVEQNVSNNVFMRNSMHGLRIAGNKNFIGLTHCNHLWKERKTLLKCNRLIGL